MFDSKSISVSLRLCIDECDLATFFVKLNGKEYEIARSTFVSIHKYFDEVKDLDPNDFRFVWKGVNTNINSG